MELADLAGYYPTIRRALKQIGTELATVQLPEEKDPQRRLDLLRELNSNGDLDIRISYAGNLNVYVRMAGDIGNGDDVDYLSVLRTPQTEWCKPVGRYSEDILNEDDPGDYVDDVPSSGEAYDRAQYRIAKIIAEELPKVETEAVRRVAERIMEELWDGAPDE